MKKFISGVVTGAILTGSIALAATYSGETAPFKILVNGKDFTSDPPALVIDERTYLPLRAVGDALGVPVEWNEEARQVEVGAKAPSVVKGKYSRNNPAPLNTMQTYTKSSTWLDEDNYSVNIRIIETIRGEKAWEKIYAANQFNSTAPDGYEYILAKVAFSVFSTKDDIAVTPSSYQFKAFSSNNEEYTSNFIVCPEPTLGGKLYEGGNTEGWICLTVKKRTKIPSLHMVWIITEPAEFGLIYNKIISEKTQYCSQV